MPLLPACSTISSKLACPYMLVSKDTVLTYYDSKQELYKVLWHQHFSQLITLGQKTGERVYKLEPFKM